MLLITRVYVVITDNETYQAKEWCIEEGGAEEKGEPQAK